MASSALALQECARYRGLARDHPTADLDLSAVFGITQGELSNPHSSIAPPIPLPQEPKLRLNKSQLQLLAAGLQPSSTPPRHKALPDPHRTRNLKLEAPLLVRHGANLPSISQRPSLDLKNLDIFSDCSNSPAEFFDLASEWDAKLSREKLQVTKDDLTYLQHVLQDPYTPEEYEEVLKDALPPYTRNPFVDDEDIELQEDKRLQDLQAQSTPLLRKRPLSPPATDLLRSSSAQFSASRALLGFMSTRGDMPKKSKSASHHFSAVQTGEGKTAIADSGR